MDKTERFEILMDPETRDLLRQLAKLEREAQATVLRKLIRDEAERRGVETEEAAGGVPGPAPDG